jgi:MFS family permease
VSSTRGEATKAKSEGERLTRWFLVLIGLSTLLQGVDRQLLGVLMDPIKHDLKLSDTAMGALAGTTFALFYVLGSFPLARLADSGSRRSLLAMCLGFWSLMTALCGFAAAGWQLAVARAGVALGEAGNIPACMSLIAEGRPKNERGRGPSIVLACQGLGTALGLVLGGLLAASLGWRWAFVLLGLPGILVALLIRFTAREPKRAPAPSGEAEMTFMQALVSFMKLPSFWLITGCITFASMAGFGMHMWAPAYFGRVHHLDIKHSGVALGLATAVGTFAANLLAGWLSDKLSRLDLRWYAWFTAIVGICSATLVYLFANVENAQDALVVFVAMQLTNSLLFVPMWASMLLIARPRTHGVGAAWLTTCVNGAGLGIGPVLLGMLNDHFSGSYGEAAIRQSVLFFALLFLVVSIFAVALSIFLRRDQHVEAFADNAVEPTS